MSQKNLKELLGLYNDKTIESNYDDSINNRGDIEYDYEDNMLNDLNAIYKYNLSKYLIYILSKIDRCNIISYLNRFLSNLINLSIHMGKSFRGYCFSSYMCQKNYGCVIKIEKIMKSLRKMVNRNEFKRIFGFFHKNQNLYRFTFHCWKKKLMDVSYRYLILADNLRRGTLGSFFLKNYKIKFLLIFHKLLNYDNGLGDLLNEIYINNINNEVISLKNRIMVQKFSKNKKIYGRKTFISKQEIIFRKSLKFCKYLFKFIRKFMVVNINEVKIFNKWKNQLTMQKNEQKISQYQTYTNKINKSKAFFLISYILVRYSSYARYFIYRIKTKNQVTTIVCPLTFESLYNNRLYNILLGLYKCHQLISKKSFILLIDSLKERQYFNSKNDKMNSFSLWKMKNISVNREIYGKLIYYLLSRSIFTIFSKQLYHDKVNFFKLFYFKNVRTNIVKSGLVKIKIAILKKKIMYENYFMCLMKSITYLHNTKNQYLCEKKEIYFIRAIKHFITRMYLSQYFHSIVLKYLIKTKKNKDIINKLNSYYKGLYIIHKIFKYKKKCLFILIKSLRKKVIISKSSEASTLVHSLKDSITFQSKLIKIKKCLLILSKYYIIKILNKPSLKGSFLFWVHDTKHYKNKCQLLLRNHKTSQTELKMKIIDYIDGINYISSKIKNIENNVTQCEKCAEKTKREFNTNSLFQSSDYNLSMQSMNEDQISRINSIPVMTIKHNNIKEMNKIKVQKYPQVKSFPTEEDENNGWDSENNELIDVDERLDKEANQYQDYLNNLEMQVKSDIISLKNKYEPTILKLQKEVDDLYLEVDTLTNLALGSNITK